MSELDTEQATSAKDTRPVVLAINCHEAQKYLTDSNEVLKALYGEAPERIDIRTSGLECFFFRGKAEARLELLQEFPDVSMNQLPDFVQSAEFYETVWQAICTIVKSLGKDPTWHERVRIVLVGGDLIYFHSNEPPKELNPDSPLPAVLLKYLPNATVFEFPGFHNTGMPELVDVSAVMAR